MEILEVKNAVTEISSVGGFKCWEGGQMEGTKGRTIKLDKRTINYRIYKEREKRQKKKKIRELWDYNKRTNIGVTAVLKGGFFRHSQKST